MEEFEAFLVQAARIADRQRDAVSGQLVSLSVLPPAMYDADRVSAEVHVFAEYRLEVDDRSSVNGLETAHLNPKAVDCRDDGPTFGNRTLYGHESLGRREQGLNRIHHESRREKALGSERRTLTYPRSYLVLFITGSYADNEAHRPLQTKWRHHIVANLSMFMALQKLRSKCSVYHRPTSNRW